MITRLLVLSLVFAFGAAGFVRSDARPKNPLYHVVDLGSLDGTSSEAFAINSHNQVVGVSSVNGQGIAGSGHAFLWHDSTMRDLGTLGGSYSVAYGLNSTGAVVGCAELLPAHGSVRGSTHAVIWQSSGVLRDLSEGTQQSNSCAYSVNDTDLVVGIGDAPGRAGNAVAWSDGRVIELENAITSGATSVNRQGIIVGTVGEVSRRSNPLAFTLWSMSLPLGTKVSRKRIRYRGLSGTANHLNARDEAVGHVGTSAFFWKQNRFQILPSLPGSWRSDAESVNDDHVIVGSSYFTNGGGDYSKAVMWRSGAMFDLNLLADNSLEWTLDQAHDVNDSGMIVGRGHLNGVPRAFMLVPSGVAPSVESSSVFPGVCSLGFTPSSGDISPGCVR